MEALPDIDALLKAQSSVPQSNKDAAGAPAGMDPNLYQQRPPIDLTNPRLRKLAAALGPAYVRVSGTWANTAYFQNSDQPAPKTPPKGFGGVLTRRQWKGVIDFAQAVDAKLVTSFATSPGTRNAAGIWTPDQARQLLAYTKSIGGSIAAAEYMNEPTYAEMGGAPKGYDAAAFGRDFSVFLPFVKKAAPDMLVLGPGGVGEGIPLAPIGLAGSIIKTEDILKATGPGFDGFSYHSYGATSKRCASMGPASQTTADAALSEDFLSRADRIEAFYAGLRDTFEPGKPLWLTETADAACGGNPWASTFLDSFRYLDQLGRLSKRGVQVHMHNTLASSDYGLLDDNTLMPRPNYWAALLWHKIMGTTVLDPGLSTASSLHLYAHCLRGQPGGVALLAINTDRSASQSLDLAHDGRALYSDGPESGCHEHSTERERAQAGRGRCDTQLDWHLRCARTSRVSAGHDNVPCHTDREQRCLPLTQVLIVGPFSSPWERSRTAMLPSFVGKSCRRLFRINNL